ncbi:MAG TPA: Wzz/FepE/Etk N-terminal domain-containing protein, partial [Flavitalea sp.]|nr:Wzz/FepE/Etk N-terminal domain-containing protein [Flavitalea sp.]
MKTQQTTASTFYIPSSQTSDFDFKAQAGKYLFHWPIIVLTMLLAAAVAYFYLQVSSPVYELNATLLIKDELKNPNKQQPLEEIDQLNIPKIVENELEILKSRTLISQVVDTLDLTVQYTEKKGLSEVDLYQHKPVLLSVVKSSVYNKEQRINITIKDQQFFYITEGKDTKYLQRFGEVFSYGSGKYIVTALSDSQHFVGKEFQILIKDRNKVIDQYQKKLETELINKQAPAVRLKIKDKVVARGKDVLDQLILLYNYSNVLEKNRLTKRNIDFIDSRIAALSGEMNKAELDVELYKTSLGLTDIPSQSKIYLENVQSTDNGMNSVVVQL